jgi:hypothetical protein
VPEPVQGYEVVAASHPAEAAALEPAEANDAPALEPAPEAADAATLEPPAFEATAVAPPLGIWTDDDWSAGADAIPLPVTAVASDAATVPTAAAMRDVATLPPPAARPLRWVAHVAIALTLFVASAATVVAMDGPSFEAATPSTTNSTPELAAPPPSGSTASSDEQRMAAEQPSTTSEQSALTVAEQGCATASSSDGAKGSKGCEQQRKAFREPPKSPAQRPAQRPRSRKLVKKQRARAAVSKKSCSGLDCL